MNGGSIILTKTSSLVGWIVGLAIGLLVFFTVGVGVLFAVSYGIMHSDGSIGSTGIIIYLFSSWIAVIAACLWLAYSIKRLLTQGRRPKV